MTPPPPLPLPPPLTQLNTPYPSTAYLTGFLKRHGYATGEAPVSAGAGWAGVVAQADVGIEMVLALFSRGGLRRVFDRVRDQPGDLPGEAAQILALERAYLDSIDAVIGFLQGQDPALAPRICQGCFLPQGPRFAHAGEPSGAFGTLGTADRARYLATLYLEDLADLVHETVTPQFALSRYAEHVGLSASSFDPVARALAEAPSLTDELLLDAVWRHVEAVDPTLVGLTVPFPGNLYGALRIAQVVKARRPAVRIVLGGGDGKTEPRRGQEPRPFGYVDYMTPDDGARPLLCLLEHLSGKRDEAELRRTILRSNGRVVWRDGARDPEFGMAELGTPTYTGLTLNRYLSVLDTLNPMHRLWSDGHWNKLTVAHGCYWKQCTFCDVGLDYIGRYEAAPSEILTDRIEALIAETGRRGFHFVDEAAPPAGLKGLALCLLERGVAITWWGNIRFETAFTRDLCRLLAASGCVAVTAGLEAASDRLLDAMKKGITVAQAARVAAAHSPIGLDPAAHGVRITGPSFGGFAENDFAHDDPAGQAPEWLGLGLRAALSSYMRGAGVAADVRHWFGRPVPRPKVPRNWVARVLEETPVQDDATAERRFVWIGGAPVSESYGHDRRRVIQDRKSTRLNSSPLVIPYAAFCLKKKNKNNDTAS